MTKMSSLRVSREVREKINSLKRNGESVDEYLQRKIQEDANNNKTTTQSLLLDALDALRKEKSEERFYPEKSQSAIDMEAYYAKRREQHDKRVADDLAESNRETEKRLYGVDEEGKD